MSNFARSDSWVVLSPIEQRIKEKIERVGVPLKDWNISINYGIKTGFNEAFIIDGEKRHELIRLDPKSAEIIRPILRGRDIKRYSYEFHDKYLITTFPSIGCKIDDYPVIKEFLAGFRAKLEQTGEALTESEIKRILTHAELHHIKVKETDLKTSRKKTNNEWFEIQDSISYWDEFSKQKIVWARLMRVSRSEDLSFPRFSLVPEGVYTVDSLCFITGEHLEYLTEVLNSDLAAYYFFSNIAILDNGGMQMRQQYIENFPIPLFDSTKQNINADTIYSLYGFKKEEVDFIDQFLDAKYEEIRNR